MAAFLSEVERFLERVFEAPARLFRTRLQPVELARAVARAMEADSQVGASGLQVPNHYVVELHPDDFRGFANWRSALERDLATYVRQRAADRGWHCPGGPRVEVRPAAAAPRGRARVVTDTVDDPLPSRAGSSSTVLGPALEKTGVLAPLPAPPRPATEEVGSAWL